MERAAHLATPFCVPFLPCACGTTQRRKPQRWQGQAAEQTAVYANLRRLQTVTGKALLRRRGEFIERSFVHVYETGGMRRVHLRKKNNIAKRVLIHVAAFNLGLILRAMMGAGTARQAAELHAALGRLLFALRCRQPMVRRSL